jgi:preprotein translocase subunit SecG
MRSSGELRACVRGRRLRTEASIAGLLTVRTSRSESNVLVALVTALHLLLALGLITLILLHRGQGGGISDMFGGGIGGAVQGSAVAERNLNRITVVAVLLFASTSIALLVLG